MQVLSHIPAYATKWRSMKMNIPRYSVLFVVLLATSTVGSLADIVEAPKKPELMDRDKEIQLALSAAPIELRAEAGVYVLEQKGFVKVRESRNGFNCLVERGFSKQGTLVIAPVCYDAEGSQTNMQAGLRTGELLMQGITSQEIDKMIDDDYRTGKLQAPRKAGIAYMLSSEFATYDTETGKSVQLYPPHIMIYAPYLRNAEIGVSPQQVRSSSHIWVSHEGRPDAYIIVPCEGMMSSH